MKCLCLLLVILVVYWYCSDNVEGFYWHQPSKEFKSGKGPSGNVQTGTIAYTILSNKDIHKDIHAKPGLPQRFFNVFDRLGHIKD